MSTNGELNPAAPPETEQWGQLAGIWEVVNHAKIPNNGETRAMSPQCLY